MWIRMSLVALVLTVAVAATGCRDRVAGQSPQETDSERVEGDIAIGMSNSFRR